MFGTSAADQRLELHALGELRAPEKILVAIRHCAQILVRTENLDVRFHDGRVLAKRLDFRLFLRHDLVHDFSQGRLLLGSCNQGDGPQRHDHRQYLQRAHNAS